MCSDVQEEDGVVSKEMWIAILRQVECVFLNTQVITIVKSYPLIV